MKRTVKTLLLASAALFCLPFAACKEETREPFFESTPELPPAIEPTPELPPKTLPPEETEEPQQKSEALYVQVLTDGLNVRKGAGTGYACLGQAEKGTLLQCVGRQDGWYETRYLGKTAYVSANERYTAIATLPRADEEAVERIVEEGLKLLGTPYVYGAVRLHDGKGGMLKNFTASAFDCSSLMQYIFYEGAGILLDVNTRTQMPPEWTRWASNGWDMSDCTSGKGIFCTPPPTLPRSNSFPRSARAISSPPAAWCNFVAERE